MKLKDDNVRRLLQMIGSPYLEGSEMEPEESVRLLELAHKNRITFMYLRRLYESGTLSLLRPEYEKNLRRYRQLYDDLARLIPVLDRLGLSYVLMKTLRYYPENPNDIDILLFNDLQSHLTSVTSALEKIGYQKYAQGNNHYNFNRIGKVGFWDYKRVGALAGTTDEIVWFDLDMYGEIMVEEYVHGDKTLLAGDCVTETFTNIVNGSTLAARVLAPAADLFYVYFHSIFPTRNLGLEVFYTTLYDLLHFHEHDYRRFAELARASRLQKEIACMANLIAQLYRHAYGTTCERIELLLDSLPERPTAPDLTEVGFPYIFPTGLFLSAAFKSGLHKKGIQSMAAVLLKSLYPPYAANIVREVFSKELAARRYTLKYDSEM